MNYVKTERSFRPPRNRINPEIHHKITEASSLHKLEVIKERYRNRNVKAVRFGLAALLSGYFFWALITLVGIIVLPLRPVWDVGTNLIFLPSSAQLIAFLLVLDVF